MVPGSTFRYGSSFCMLTPSPRALSSRPRLEAVRPLPRLEATPPVTKRCLVSVRRDASKGRLPWSIRGGESHPSTGHQDISQRSNWAAAPQSLLVRVSVACPSQGVRGRLAVGRLPDPALRCGESLLVGLAEPGQGDRADDGEAEPEHGDPAQA